MARADLLLQLVKASAQKDQILFRKTLEALIAEERKLQHHVVASRLEQYLKPGATTEPISAAAPTDFQQTFYELVPKKSLETLIFPEKIIAVVKELIEEHRRRDLLQSHSLEPRHRILLAGPPGNGKTSLAESVAHSLMLPLIVVRYEGIIGSYLGETASRLKKLFDHVRSRNCVLFFDEFDTLGKERGDIHETGEIKRVVSSLLLQVDALPSHVIVIAATNHSELLDRAVWRRFQLRLNLPAPSKEQLEEWFRRFSATVDINLGFSPEELAETLHGLSFAEVEEFSSDIRRRQILEFPDKNIRQIITERLDQWGKRFQLQKRKD